MTASTAVVRTSTARHSQYHARRPATGDSDANNPLTLGSPKVPPVKPEPSAWIRSSMISAAANVSSDV
jgi:hypothetical protein